MSGKFWVALTGLAIAAGVCMLPAVANAGSMNSAAVLAKAGYIQLGTSGRIIYDFFDPNCPYCAKIYEREAPYIQAGKLTVRYVPVGVVAADSKSLAEDILQARNPQLRLAQDMQELERGITPIKLPGVTPTAATRSEIRYNNSLLTNLGLQGLPAIALVGPGGLVHLGIGLPPMGAFSSLTSTVLPSKSATAP